MQDERTQEIIRLFKLSWIEIKVRHEELLYKQHFQPQLIQPFIDFINKMIDEGEDKFFRVGTCMGGIMLSRSVEPRLRRDQKHIKIEAFDDGFRVFLRDGGREYRNYKVVNLQDEKFIKLVATLKPTIAD